MWHNKTQSSNSKSASLEDTRTWCPAWIQWEHWGCRRRQQRLLLSLASSLLASFAGTKYINLRRARARTPRISHGCYTLVLLAKASPLPFIATRGLTEGEPVTKQCTFHGCIHCSVHGSIHGCSQKRNNANSPNNNVTREPWIKSRTSRVLFLKLFRVQSVWRIRSNHFSRIFYPKKRSFRIPDLIKPADILKNKIWCHVLDP